MSALGIGADTATVVSGNRENKAGTNVPQTIVKWIPGEAITFYAGILGIGAAQAALTGAETPEQLLERIAASSFRWFALGAAIALALVVLGALSEPREAGHRLSGRALLVRMVLALIAFGLWTSAIPGSWTFRLHPIRDMGAAYALLLVPIGLLFAAVAEWATRTVKL